MSRQIRTDRTVQGLDAALSDLISRAHATDNQPPFNDQTRIALATGSAQIITAENEAGTLLGVAVRDGAGFEAVIDPSARGLGHGGALIAALLDTPGGAEITSAWAHGDHPGAAALARRHAFSRKRVLYRLARALDAGTPSDARDTPPSLAITTFDADRDADDWVALNARVFATHPEQGAILRADLDARIAEDWFDPRSFLLVRDAATHALIAYNWLKIEPGSEDGEIYVIGVAEEAAGRGLGRHLMNAGLARFVELGLSTASLYVDDSNAGAVALYRSLGFETDTVDVQYRRPQPGVRS
ncbi:mycothiol synthase [Mycetocola tolaasinivorans]|uniref:mycothiol synthase n=1 Tax=Mycetocola tolaasinivorans TaxID=76635 RepID=UPI0016015366|nr:mycothiol synthase [Mycetocola tolaasinivorans]